MIYGLAQRGDALATLLYTTAFAKMRFAWHAPWATRNGWPGEQYGDYLIKVTLKPEAIIVALATATGAFEARNLLNEAVSREAVIARPERIAAIYFVSDAALDSVAGIPRPIATFREYALCNEAMIESWEVGTPEIARELAANIATVEAMVRYLKTMPPNVAVQVSSQWATSTPNPRPEAAFAAALALDSSMYRRDAVQLAALAERLRMTSKPAAFTSVGTAAFVAPTTVRKPPRIVRRGNSTYASSYSQPRQPTAAHP